MRGGGSGEGWGEGREGKGDGLPHARGHGEGRVRPPPSRGQGFDARTRRGTGLCSRGEGWVGGCARTRDGGGAGDGRREGRRDSSTSLRSVGHVRDGGNGGVGGRDGMGPRIREDTGRGSGFVPRLRGGRVSTRGWRREDGSPHARGHGGGLLVSVFAACYCAFSSRGAGK